MHNGGVVLSHTSLWTSAIILHVMQDMPPHFVALFGCCEKNEDNMAYRKMAAAGHERQDAHHLWGTCFRRGAVKAGREKRKERKEGVRAKKADPSAPSTITTPLTHDPSRQQPPPFTKQKFSGFDVILPLRATLKAVDCSTWLSRM